MKFAIQTMSDVIHGTRDRKIHALFTLLIWFSAGAFITSSLLSYVALHESLITSVIGGGLVCCTAALLKAI